ncbi:exopolysaccharide Pel transporter PelG [Fictibacillus nanhaiensis]|uniref:exopolysaccharide Pel transporter PelG n=1 Tax=Fictibacillus nanhaiensis TaxID=742169 RepID=UPI001C981F6A|nr:exopolysaccharide Pel transporter PelG [Fictibacillus nanhaiensis]MBY6036656.1 exopolysaccharide Pel transporter PelG [Fictibacillus nanhaiensis]
MAGIGFQLQKLFKEDYYSSRIKAYLYSLFVTAGPWLLVITTITVLQLAFSRVGIAKVDRELFLLSVTYCFIFSQVLFGLQQLVVTRYVSDCLYEDKPEKVLPAFLGMLKTTVALAVLLWLVFAFLAELPISYKLLVLGLFISINAIWVLFLFLSGAKNYSAISFGFLAGGFVTLVSTALCLYVDVSLPIAYSQAHVLLACFWLGFAVTLLWLSHAVFATYPASDEGGEFEYLRYFDYYPSLFITGTLYNIGLWTGNGVIWLLGESEQRFGFFLFMPQYDSALFYAYLSILPTYVLFVVSVETRFYERYRTYYEFVNKGGNLKQIHKAKDKMILVLKQEIERLFRTQGLFSAGLIGLTFLLVPIVLANDLFVHILRYAIIGAFCNGLTLVMILLLLYFDDRKGAAWSAYSFFMGVLLFSLVLLPFGPTYYGMGFVIGSLISMIISFVRLFSYVEKIDYYTFCHTEYKREDGAMTKLSILLNRIA